MGLLQDKLKNSRSYHYRLRFAFELNDEYLDKIERVLRKYDLKDLSPVEKTIVHKTPLDFNNLDKGEIYIIDCVLSLPVSSYILKQEMVTTLKVHDNYIIIRTDNEPGETQTEEINAKKAINDEAKRRGLIKTSYLSTDSDYIEAEVSIDGSKFFGNEYNSRFLKKLSAIAASRPENIVDASSSLFDWLPEIPNTAPEDDFNAGIDGAPKVFPRWSKIKKDVETDDEKFRSESGAYDDDRKTYFEPYKDKNGKRVLVKVNSNSVR